MKITLVTRDTVYGRFLADELSRAAAIDGVLIETGRPSWRVHWRKLRRVGPVNAAFQVGLNHWFEREGRRHLPAATLPGHTTIRTVNAYPIASDELLVGFGTSIVSAATLARAPLGILNLHTGWLPDFRGVKSEFWCLYEGRGPAGWTVHFMTPRLDEGDILLQQAVPRDGANPAELRARLVKDAAPALADLLTLVRRDGARVLSGHPQRAGQYYTTPTWRQWRAYRRRSRTPIGANPSR